MSTSPPNIQTEATHLLSPPGSTSCELPIHHADSTQRNVDHYHHFSYSDWNHRRRLLMGAVTVLVLFVVLPFVGWTVMLNSHIRWHSYKPTSNIKTNITQSVSNSTASTVNTIHSPSSNVPNFEHGSNTIQIHYQSFNPKLDVEQHSNKHSSSSDSHDMGYCQDNALYSAFTLRTAYELPIHALVPFSYNGNTLKFPFSASAITSSDIPMSTSSGDDGIPSTHFWYAVAENSWSILQFQPMLYPPGSSLNRWIHHPILRDSATTMSNYHAIFQFNSIFYIVRKSVRHFLKQSRGLGQDDVSSRNNKSMNEKKEHSHEEKKDKEKQEKKKDQHNHTEQGGSKEDSDQKNKIHSTSHGDGEDVFSYHAIIEEISIHSTSDFYNIQDQCRCEMTFEGPTRYLYFKYFCTIICVFILLIFSLQSGFKGAKGMPGIDGTLYILALCEGNHCSEKKSDDAGNGKLVLMRKKKKSLASSSSSSTINPQPTSQPSSSIITYTTASPTPETTLIPLSNDETTQQNKTTRKEKHKKNDTTSIERMEELLPQIQMHDMMNLAMEHDAECIWETVQIIDIPKTAYFRDYSDMDITNDGKIIISTQKESAVWIGRLKGIDQGIINPNGVSFDKHEMGIILSFPKSDSCYTKYCNIEGIHVLNDYMIMGVSGIMQGHGQQDFRYVSCGYVFFFLHIMEL